MLITNQKIAEQNKTTHKLVSGKGYISVGILKMPSHPINPPAMCEPPAGTPSDTIHVLLAPYQSEDGDRPFEIFMWDAIKREWSPLVADRGKRLAFSSAYLAAHGWNYDKTRNHHKGVPVMDLR
jgi:hypothetical protein